jgi:hypothetical protein
MKNTKTISQISPDLVKAIGDIKSVKKDSQNPFLKNKYASLDAIIEATKKILSTNNLCIIQSVSEQGVETTILHVSGEWISSDFMVIPTEQSKGLSNAQSRGVAITYCKRYQLGSILGISTDDDMDGHYEEKPEVKVATETNPIPMTDPVFEKFVIRMNKREKDWKELPTKIRKAFILNSTQDKHLKLFEADAIKETK